MIDAGPQGHLAQSGTPNSTRKLRLACPHVVDTSWHPLAHWGMGATDDLVTVPAPVPALPSRIIRCRVTYCDRIVVSAGSFLDSGKLGS